MLQAHHITQSFYNHSLWCKQEKRVLDNVSFSLQKGTNTALIGPSGCGKSTLAKVVAQLQKPQSGTISLQGKVVALNTLESRRIFYRQLQILFQDPISSLNPRYSVAQNLQEPLQYLLGIHDARIWRKMICAVFEQLKLPQTLLHYYPSMLSGGQAQRVCVARALLIQPQVILLDETTSGLDYELQEILWNVFLDMQRQFGTTFLFITHDIVLARKYCHTLLLMEEGRIIERVGQHEAFQSMLGRELMLCCEAFKISV